MSWLRHRDAGGMLDWALLRGASSEELQDIRNGWQNHILHLRRDHSIDVVQEPPGFYRLVGASIPPGEAKESLARLDPCETGGQETEVTDSGELGSEFVGSQSAAAFNARPRHTANALIALHQSGELANPLHKAAVGMLIRQVSECNHWHNSTHYRSRSAAELIAAADIQTAAQYQDFCRKNLRHEHIVPNIVLYRMITQRSEPTDEWLLDLFARYALRATITREEDRLLRRSDMPPGFLTKGHVFFENPLARYMEVGLDRDLVPRTQDRWFPT